MRNQAGLLVGMLSSFIAAACSPQSGTGEGRAAATDAPRMDKPSVAQAQQAPDSRESPMTMGQAAVEPSPQQGGPAQAALTRVEDASAVCMVNNTYMGRPQIPVQVEGRTYFGCCDMCKGRLERDPSARYATDPVSGRQVDKSAAVIGRDASNRVLYFENEATYRKFAGT